MDPTKPYGEACTPDGGLKDADEIDWVNDPDDPISMPASNGKSAVANCFKTIVHSHLN
jgi:hypothetical protein